MNDQVRATLDGAARVRGRERVVGQQQRPVLVGYGRESGEVRTESLYGDRFIRFLYNGLIATGFLQPSQDVAWYR